MQKTENPYQPPQTFNHPPASPPSDSEIVRRVHLNTEASIKSIGILYYLLALGIILRGLSVSLAVKGPLALVSIFLFLALAAGVFVVGSAVRKFKSWSRIIVALFSAVGLLSFPIFPLGTLIGGYFLYLIFGKKGRMVFSERYQEVLAATPHIKYKTPVSVWILLAIIGGLILFGITKLMIS